MTKYEVEFVGTIPKGFVPKKVYIQGSNSYIWNIEWEKLPEYDIPIEILPEGWWIAKDSNNCKGVHVFEEEPGLEDETWTTWSEYMRIPEWIAENLDPEWLKLNPKDSLYQQHKKGKK